MRKLLAPTGLAVLAAVALAPGGAGAATKVYWPGCGAFDKPAFKPKKIILTCGDGSTTVQKIKWSAWGTDEAMGTGTFRINQCQPTCSNGSIKKYPVTLRLYRPKSCPEADRREWSRLRFNFPKKHPKAYSRKNKQKLRCAD